MEKLNLGVTLAVIVAVVLVGFGIYNLNIQKNSALPNGSVIGSSTSTAIMASSTDTLIITTEKEGSGEEAKDGDKVTVHYTGWLTNGSKFDSSKDLGKPFTFTLGAGTVIRGWDVGVKGMKVGEQRKLVIPADMAYGETGAGDVIPPNATLVFEVEMLGIGK